MEGNGFRYTYLKHRSMQLLVKGQGFIFFPKVTEAFSAEFSCVWQSVATSVWPKEAILTI